MIELRGITIDYLNGSKRTRLTIRKGKGDDYETFIFPLSLPLNRGQIIKFIGETYGIPPGQVKIAPHVKIPEA